MIQNMQGGLSSKIKLRFNSAGKFKILVMSDIQEHCDFSPISLENIQQMLDSQKPDLVLLGGDNCNGPKIKTEAQLKEYISYVAKPFEERGIPWAQVWGNHDHDVRLDKDMHQTLYMSYDHNISSTVPEISGQSNFVLPVFASNSEDIVFNVWGLDSGPHSAEHMDANIDGDMLTNATKLPHKVNPHQSCWGLICFDQLMWYYNSSKKFEEEYSKKIPGLLVTHVPLYEFCVVRDNPEQCGTVGECPEFFGLATFNSGLFATIIQRGDIKAICCGHSHDNTQSGTYCGITLCNDGSIGASCYGTREHKGARVFEIDEKEPDVIKTRFIKVDDL